MIDCYRLEYIVREGEDKPEIFQYARDKLDILYFDNKHDMLNAIDEIKTTYKDKLVNMFYYHACKIL